jgi:hypothetical protein
MAANGDRPSSKSQRRAAGRKGSVAASGVAGFILGALLAWLFSGSPAPAKATTNVTATKPSLTTAPVPMPAASPTSQALVPDAAPATRVEPPPPPAPHVPEGADWPE